jgi:Ca-activated chloride channel family protein
MHYRAFAASAAFAFCGFLASPAGAAGQDITLDATLARPVMKEGAAQKNYLKVALGGCRPEPSRKRTPVNVAFVIDRSGSMQGERLAQARAAAIMAVNRLGPRDIASVVVFDQAIRVLVPAQPVTDHAVFTDSIARIGAGGSTAIHAGVLTGRDEVLKFKDARRLNRIVLLSDGQANVGPSRVTDFSALGNLLLGQGVSVSTIGLGFGYNEDLMLELARNSDGNHAFARDPTDLIAIFNREFNDVLSSCAQTVSIDIDLKPGVRAVKAISRDGTIAGSKAQFRMNQVYAATEHYVLLEVELDPQLAVSGEQELGTVTVAYTPAGSSARRTLDTVVRGRFTASEAEVTAAADPKVAEVVLEQVARSRAREAVSLRDKGQHEEARRLLLQNATEIKAFGARTPGVTRELMQLGEQYQALGSVPASAAPSALSAQRKALRELDANRPGTARRY